MSSPESGFLVKCRLRTRNNNATYMNAAINWLASNWFASNAATLATNWFCYLFDEAILRLGGNCVEHVRQLGIVIDMFYHMQNNEFMHQNGQLCGYILIQVIKSLILLEQESVI